MDTLKQIEKDIKEKGFKPIFSGIVGSHSHGLSTKDSDIDYKGLYIAPNDYLLNYVCKKRNDQFIDQINNDTNDIVFYELSKFIFLLEQGNPNALELLFIPLDCYVETSPQWEILRQHRAEFLTKQCYNTFVGYANSQLKKATALDKMSRWEKDRIERKDITDFMTVVLRKDGKVKKMNEYRHLGDSMGLTSIDGFRDCYKLYFYGGQGLGTGNEPKKSVIDKVHQDEWKGIAYWNREAYSTHCKDYRNYQTWLESRNEARYIQQNEHGQTVDSKNLAQMVRLLINAEEIAIKGTLSVNVNKHREELLDIKQGKVNLEEVIENTKERIENLGELFATSRLTDKVDPDFVRDLELKIRKYE